jgi:hypothetical protein
MKINSIKRLCFGLGTVALLILMAACSTGSQSTADTGGPLSTTTSGSPVPTVAYTNANGTLKIDAKFATIDVTPGSVATGNPGKVIVTQADGTTIPTQEDPTTHVITLTKPYPFTGGNLKVLLITPVDLDLSVDSGNINVTAVKAQMVLSATNGTITTNAVTLVGNSHFRIASGSGGTIQFSGSLDQNSATLFEGDGFVSAKLPKDAAFHLHATVTNGTVNTSFTVPAHAPNSIDADINGGKSPVLTITANNTIQVDKQ